MTKTPKPASMDPGETPLFQRQVKVDDIKDGAEGLIEANPVECRAIAETLDLVALHRLACAYRLHHQGGGRIGLKGTLQAAATQTCVVSLEPVESVIDVPVEMEFWPLALIGELSTEDKAHPLRDWPEPIREGKVDLGAAIYETFATALDPFPKREGASLDWQDGEGQPQGEQTPKGPFAALAPLKRR
jgi:uncharacterized protein DUF177 involved in 23S rRNA accumulation